MKCTRAILTHLWEGGDRSWGEDWKTTCTSAFFCCNSMTCTFWGVFLLLVGVREGFELQESELSLFITYCQSAWCDVITNIYFRWQKTSPLKSSPLLLPAVPITLTARCAKISPGLTITTGLQLFIKAKTTPPWRWEGGFVVVQTTVWADYDSPSSTMALSPILLSFFSLKLLSPSLSRPSAQREADQ